VEGFFFNDLVAFDLNALQQPTNRWEVLITNTSEGGQSQGPVPPARTNHTMITWGDKLYLFGGTDGMNWFNDVWSYSPHTNSWTLLECIGYIPSPREGHAAALVGDVMYVFGGRTEEGNDLGDLAAFRISSRRWYTFQNMGPSPSPRSGHSMTTVGKQVIVLAGEPSSAPRDPVELGLAYCLDTTKIRYPPDSANERVPGQRRPSAADRAIMGSGPPSRGPPPRELMERERANPGDGRIRSPDSLNASRLPRSQSQSANPQGPNGIGTRMNNTAPFAKQSPQQGQQPPSKLDSARAFSPAAEMSDQYQRYDSPNMVPPDAGRTSSLPRDQRPNRSLSAAADTQQAASVAKESAAAEQRSRQEPSSAQDAAIAPVRSSSRTQPTKTATRRDSDIAELPENLPKDHLVSREQGRPQDSGLGSSPALIRQNDELAKELEQMKQRNIWYASELALARKSGYHSRSTDSPALEESAMDALKDDDRPLIEALLKMRGELARVQETIDEQSKTAAKRIAEVEKQRDAAISEAVFARAKYAGQPSAQSDSEPTLNDRNNDISRRLASSLATQADISRRVETLTQELDAEKNARRFAEETADAAQKRVSELDAYRQQHASELETLRANLHVSERDARDAANSHSEVLAQHQLLSVDKAELSGRLDLALAETQNHSSVLSSLRDAITASTEKAQLLEQKLEEERVSRAEAERTFRDLRVQHDARASELEIAAKRLRDAEELTQKHSDEARLHREAVLAGLGQVTKRQSIALGANSERLALLQQQVESANALARGNQTAADAASEKLRRAEERIAGLEAYQEQASREGLSLRKQLQSAIKESQSLSSEKSELEQKMQRHLLDSNALSVQHASLKDILGERGVNVSEARKSRALDSPASNRFSTPDISRLKELELQLETSLKTQEDLRSQMDEIMERDEKMKREYEEKLTALDNDHQAAVKYLRGTERMLSKMKQELQRAKNENGELKKRIDKATSDAQKDGSRANGSADDNKLREELTAAQETLKSTVSDLERQLQTMQQQLQSTESELQHSRSEHDNSRSTLSTLQAAHSESKAHLDRLQRENSLLENRARDAEGKVQVLLDQVESSVDNYRRRSRMGVAAGAAGAGSHNAAVSHQRTVSGTVQNNSTHANGISPNGKMHSRDDGDDHDGIDIDTDLDDTASSVPDEARNSLALDSLASELDALRSHWETTSKTYRLSAESRLTYDQDHDRTPTTETRPALLAISGAGGLADWRRGLEAHDVDDVETLGAHHDGANSS